MSKKSLFRRPFKKWHRKRAEISLEAERQHVYDIDSSLRTEFGLKKAPWVIHKILALFVNPLTADNKFFLLNRGNLFQHFQMHLSHKWKIFVPFFFFFFFAFCLKNITIIQVRRTIPIRLFLFFQVIHWMIIKSFCYVRV